MSPLLRSAAVVIAGVLVAALLGLATWAYTEGEPPFGQADDSWSGVFLTNGQAYFGHFSSPPGDYAKLRDVYYVLATQLQSQDPNAAAQTQLSLQKLGGEVHGPKSSMRIMKTQILFVEELRADSPLVAAIAQLKLGGGPAPAPTQRPTLVPASPPVTPVTPTRSPSPSPGR